MRSSALVVVFFCVAPALRHEQQDVFSSIVALAPQDLNPSKSLSRQESLVQMLEDNPKRDELKAALQDFRVFRQKLAAEENSSSTFARLCTAATGKPHSVTCGATLSCFVELYGSTQTPYYPNDRQIRQACSLWKPFGPPVASRAGRWLVENSPELLNPDERRNLTREFARQPLKELSETLLGSDPDEALPRIFVPYMQWNKITEGKPLTFNWPGFSMADLSIRISAWCIEEYLRDPRVTQAQRDELEVFPIAAGNKDVFLSQTEGALWKLWENPSSPADFPVALRLAGSSVGRLQVQLTLAKVNELCKELLMDTESATPSPDVDIFSEDCPAVQIAKKSVPEIAPPDVGDTYQNHIFAVVKRTNDDFSIVQGYVGGYDFSEWVRSGNKFASNTGFNKEVMAEFLGHLSTFVENSAGFGTWDGKNHKALALLEETKFLGSKYVARFSFGEMGEDGMQVQSKAAVRNQVIKKSQAPLQAMPASTSRDRLRAFATEALKDPAAKSGASQKFGYSSHNFGFCVCVVTAMSFLQLRMCDSAV